MPDDRKVCVVAGIGPGLGMGIARRFGREKFRIAMISRSAEKQAGYRSELAAAGIEAHGFVADLRDYGAVGRAFADIRHALGPVDVMVYSPQPPLVGDLRDWMPVTMKLDELQRCMDICRFAAINCVHQVAADMVGRGSGSILLTTSGSAIEPIATLGSIGLSMAATRNYAFSLHETLRPSGVHAGSVCLSLLVEKGDPHGDPDVLAEHFWTAHRDADRAETQVRTDVDVHQHHREDMVRFGRDIPEI